jgi:hypothetical protein
MAKKQKQKKTSDKTSDLLESRGLEPLEEKKGIFNFLKRREKVDADIERLTQEREDLIKAQKAKEFDETPEGRNYNAKIRAHEARMRREGIAAGQALLARREKARRRVALDLYANDLLKQKKYSIPLNDERVDAELFRMGEISRAIIRTS